MFDALLNTPPSAICEIHDKRLTNKGLQLLIKRDDLIHAEISGNKWRKLKWNILEWKKKSKSYIISYGGAYSNHIYALAAVGKAFNIPTIGIIRGEERAATNTTLQFAQACGMKLYFVDRQLYRDQKACLKIVEEDLSNALVIPEGGTNQLAMRGCEEIITETTQSADYWCVCCGTGGTITGMIAALNDEHKVIGFSALKGDFLQTEVANHLMQHYNKNYSNWEMNSAYHFGGYARYQDTLISFINEFKQTHQIALDPIYTGKMFYGIFDLIEQDYFPKGSRIMAVHTGGLQGIQGFNQRYGQLID